ncbi:MAG TPA: Asp-tRNA(Asn)/Glu-tRNA(Gln) amidotransferase subunit GatC [Nitrososphaera sp.]|nr:Asp-tRNA(Asn)/Glu-tRNA(Gln) amidotransferase subunit GatC [Nitrososphaera sp.]
MTVTREQVKHLGWLSRIDLTEDELARYTAQIEEIINYLDKLDAVPFLEEAKPVMVKKKYSELREDSPADFAADAFGTLHRKDGFVKGPRMV